MMKILEYNDVDPSSVSQLNLLALESVLTPERVVHLRQSDQRHFPFFAIYAEENGRVIGQLGVFRLPMVSTEGREDVGGIWALSTHPQHSECGIAAGLLDEAHARMRDVGLRFSALQTNRWQTTYKLYQQHGYEDTQVLASAMATWEMAHQPTRLHAQPPGPKGYDFVDKLFEKVAHDYLGFAWRHTPFARLRDIVSPEDIWILWENDQPVGYALAHVDKVILKITNILVHNSIDTAEAIAALVARLKTSFILVSISRPGEIASLQRAGYQVTHPNWKAFMVKPLVPDVTVDDARRRFGIGTDRFLISWLDVT